MPIFKGDNWQHLYKGDGHPAALYKGSKKLAGWTEESQAGVSHAYFEDTYNDKADVVIHGKSSQVETTGAQLLNVNTVVQGGVNTDTGDLFVSQVFVSTDYIPVEAGNYFVSGTSINVNFNVAVAFDGNKTVLPDDNINIRANGGRMLVPEGVKYVRIRFISDNGTSGTITPEQIAAKKPMLNRGTAALPWEPYTGGAPSPSPDYPQEITSVGDSGSVEVVSTGENLYTGGDLYNVTGTESKTFLALGTIMRLDAICDNVSGSVSVYMTAVYYDKDSNRLGSNGRAITIEEENVPYVFDMSGVGADHGEDLDMSNVRKVRLDITNYIGYDGVFNVRNIMIQPLITDKPLNDFSGYEQEPSTATFSTPNGLPGIPVDSGGNYIDEDGQQWICDEIDTKKGVYRQNVKKVTYTGDNDEYWTRYNVTQYAGFATDAADRKIASFNPGFSNRFPIDLNNTNKSPGIWLGSTVSTDPSTRITFHNCNPSIASSLEEWRTWLSTHPVTLIYPLETPVETPLSDAVDTFLGGTNLFISEHEMDVTVKTEDQANPTGA